MTKTTIKDRYVKVNDSIKDSYIKVGSWSRSVEDNEKEANDVTKLDPAIPMAKQVAFSFGTPLTEEQFKAMQRGGNPGIIAKSVDYS
jgi:protoheme ferro-lyase